MKMITIKLKTELQRLAMRGALSAGTHGLHKRENATKNPKMMERLTEERRLLLEWQRKIEEE